MKIAIVFVLVALSCLLDSGNALVPAGGRKVVASKGTMIPKNCLERFIKWSLPGSLDRLQELLCLFMSGKKAQNEQLYKKFLCELHAALIDAGCTFDEILSLPQFLEKVGDEIGKVAEQLGCEILKLLEELKISDVVLDVLCQALGETLKTLSKTLAGLDLGIASDVLGGGGLVGGVLAGGGLAGGVLKKVSIAG
ncbi:ranaspumin-like isoform X1 [Dendrobates tinctorius]|uniref:ranaspumin-like isoform X1 n=2 Tax=Dendrobates tinctorius TaxID=92724 RepID=UPI003CC98F63